MPQHYQLLKPRLNLGPSTAARVVYAKSLLRILTLLKFFRVSNGIHTNAYSFFLKKWGEILKEHIEHLNFLTVEPIIHTKKLYNGKYNKY